MNAICFTGHRTVRNPQEVRDKLIHVLDRLIQDGASDFYAGGAIGFDTLAASAVIQLRQKYGHIKLHLVLPCCEAEQTARWSDSQKSVYHEILVVANSIEYISDHYYDGCMKKRNARMVELSDGCVCYYNENNSASGTGQTVRMALKKDIMIVNLYLTDESQEIR